MNMKMNVSNTILIPSELAFGVFPFGFVFLITLPPLSFTAKRKRLFIPHLYTPFPICSCTEDTAGAFKTPQIGPFNSLQFRYVCHDLSVWKQAAKITIARWKCATFQIIIYQAEEKNLIFRTSRILAWGKSRVGQPPYFITVRTR